jgi:hypothetical protein
MTGSGIIGVRPKYTNTNAATNPDKITEILAVRTATRVQPDAWSGDDFGSLLIFMIYSP